MTVDYATANGTATAGSDYTATSGTLTFAPGTLTQTVTVRGTADALNEPTETFLVNLSAPVNATIGDGQATGTITDDDGAPVLSIGDVTVAEGGGTATFAVTLSGASAQTVTVDYATANGTATAGSDYTATSGTLTIPAGSTTGTVTVAVTADALNEPTETFLVNLSAPVNATIGDGQATGTITDDDGAPVLSIGDVTVAEGGGTATFTVTLSAASGQTVTVGYATANGTATAGSDYTATTGTLTFAPGTLTQTVGVPILADALNEPTETFLVNLSAPVNATIGDGQATGTITDDDGAPVLSIGDVTVAEGGGTATFTVTLSAASGQTVTVGYATANGTATAGSDYTATTGTLTFAPGTLTQTVGVPILADALNEPTETFLVNLSAPVNATIGDGQATGTITDDDGAPVLSIGDVSVLEGNSGGTNATFTLTLSAPSGLSVTVPWTTADGTATAADSDYRAASGTVTFAAGVTTRTINVRVYGDRRIEPDETFVVNLGAPVNATVADGQGVGTILTDDVAPTPSLRISDITVSEASAAATLTVTLSGASAQTVTVEYATANGTATAGSDYTAASGTLTFAPGQTTQTLLLPVLDDTLPEPSETFVVNLSNLTNATMADNQGVVTITDNDSPLPSVTIDDRSVVEGNNGGTNVTFTVTLSAASSSPVTMLWATADGTATAGSDYRAGSGTVTFAPGVTTAQVTVRVFGDRQVEPDETYFVNLSNPANAVLVKGQGLGRIVNND